MAQPFNPCDDPHKDQSGSTDVVLNDQDIELDGLKRGINLCHNLKLFYVAAKKKEYFRTVQCCYISGIGYYWVFHKFTDSY